MSFVSAFLASALASACVVQGGEEHGRENDLATVGILRFEATNGAGDVVGSGCTLDLPAYYDRVRFQAKSGERVELTERFQAVWTTKDVAKAHAEDVDYWCAQRDTQKYVNVPDPTCWKVLEPSQSNACFTEEGVAGAIDATRFVPDTPQAVQDETDGFKLSITVKGSGKQCVNVTCGSSFPAREQLAFVIE